MLLLTACSSSYKDEEQGGEQPPTVITFYVYASEKPIPTRADADKLIEALEAENEIHSFQIWVFTHDVVEGIPRLVGYLEPSDKPTDEGTVYQMVVSQEFANAATKPKVDVFVLANAASVGLTFDENTTKDELEAAVIGEVYFGVNPPCSTIDSDKGLPMSGVLLDRPVVGDNPVLRIGTDSYSGMDKVLLQRAVSKVRFVFCQQDGLPEDSKLKITGITLNGVDVNNANAPCGFPKQEFLFLTNDGNDYHIVDGESPYITDVTILPLPTGEEDLPVAECNDPSQYIYMTQTAQDYEDLINGGVNKKNADTGEPDPDLTAVGPFYFRETDKLLSGTISYKIGDSEETQTKPFTMNTGSNFYRNHSWIVYAYYGSEGLDVLTVYFKQWNIVGPYDRTVYNW